MLHWSEMYVGTPYRDLGRDATGVDCLGLVNLVYDHELGIILPSYTGRYASAEEAAEVDGIQKDAERTWTQVSKAAEFDVVLFRRGIYRRHLGIVVRPGLMLHADEETVRIENYNGPRWASRALGTFRHASRLAGAH